MLVIIVLGTAIYSNTFDVPFLFDDLNNIVDNQQIRVAEFSPAKFYNAAIESRAPRPVSYFSFALNYYFGGYDVSGYHAVNLLIHLLNGILVYLLATLTFRLSLGGNQGKLDTQNSQSVNWLALFAACLFVAHPLQTQAVTYLVQRMTSLATLFYLLSLWLYIHGRLNQSPKIRRWYWVGCLFAGLVALGSKQIAVTLPLVIALYEWYFFRDLNKQWAVKNTNYLAVVFLILGAIAFIFLGSSPWQHLVEGYEIRDFTMSQRLLTQFRVVIMYLGLVVWPLPSRLNLLYHVPVSNSLFDPVTTLISLLAIVALIGLAIYLARKHRLYSFCILWFLLNLVLESSVVALEMVYEHRVYLPMFAIALAVPFALHKLFAKTPVATMVVAAILVLAMSRGTYLRNEVWRDATLFWSDVIAKNTHDHRAFIGRGNEYRQNAQLDLAIADYTKAIEIKPDYTESISNRGICYSDLKKYESALKDFNQAIQLEPDFAPAFANRGKLYQRQGKHQQALNDFDKAIEIAPSYDVAYYNRAIVHSILGQHQQAVEDLSKTIQLAPESADAYNNRAIAYRELGQPKLALQDYNQAIQINPQDAYDYNNRGVTHRELGNSAQAIQDFTQAISLLPNYPVAYQNRGTDYLQLKQYDRALADFNKALALQPNHAPNCKNLAWLLATSPVAHQRNGKRAVQLAQKACQLTDWKAPICIDALAAALAETGDFAEAVQWQTKLVNLAPAHLKPELQHRLKLYQAEKPFRLP